MNYSIINGHLLFSGCQFKLLAAWHLDSRKMLNEDASHVIWAGAHFSPHRLIWILFDKCSRESVTDWRWHMQKTRHLFIGCWLCQGTQQSEVELNMLHVPWFIVYGIWTCDSACFTNWFEDWGVLILEVIDMSVPVFLKQQVFFKTLYTRM